MNGKHVPVENKKLIIEILRWARLITDAGGGHVMFTMANYTNPRGDEEQEDEECHD